MTNQETLAIHQLSIADKFVPLGNDTLSYINNGQLESKTAKAESELSRELNKIRRSAQKNEKKANKRSSLKRLMATSDTKAQKTNQASIKTLLNTLPLTTKDKKVIMKSLGQPEKIKEAILNFDLAQLDKASKKDVEVGQKIAKTILAASKKNPAQFINTAQLMLKDNPEFGDNFLALMSQANLELAETIQTITKTDLNITKLDQNALDQQVTQLQKTLDDMKTQTQTRVNKIKQAERTSFLMKLVMGILGAALFVVGAITSIAGGAGIGLMVAGAVLIGTATLAPEIQKGIATIAESFTSDKKEQHRIELALSVIITVIAIAITAVFTCGTSALAGPAFAAQLAGNTLMAGSVAMNATGGINDAIECNLDSEYFAHASDKAKKKSEDEEIAMIVTIITALVGGGISGIASRFGTVAETAANVAEDGAEQSEGLLSKMKSFLSKGKDFLTERTPQSIKNLGEFISNNSSIIAMTSSLAVGGVDYKLQVTEAQAQLAAAYAQLFAAIDEATFKQGIESVKLVRQGLSENQTALEAQTTQQVQQEGTRTKNESEAFVKIAQTIESAVKA